MFLPGESQGRGAWWAAVYGVAQSRTRLKRLSSSSSSMMMDQKPPLTHDPEVLQPQLKAPEMLALWALPGQG